MLFIQGGLPRVGHAVGFALVGGVGLPSAFLTPSAGSAVGSHSLGYGGGILFEFPAISAAHLELGILYMPRGYSLTPAGGAATEYHFMAVQFPLLVRFHLLPSVSLGLGAYFSHGLGSVTSYPSSDPTSTTTILYNASSYGADDYGVVASLGFRMRLLGGAQLILDGRYVFGLPNVSQMTGVSVYHRDLQFLAGIQFGG